jgi:hypothetical protein
MQEQSNPATTIKASDPWQRFLDGRAEFKMHAPSVTIRPSMMAAAPATRPGVGMSFRLRPERKSRIRRRNIAAASIGA